MPDSSRSVRRTTISEARQDVFQFLSNEVRRRNKILLDLTMITLEWMVVEWFALGAVFYSQVDNVKLKAGSAYNRCCHGYMYRILWVEYRLYYQMLFRKVVAKIL